MTYDPNDPTRRRSDENMRMSSDRTPTGVRGTNNTGMIGAIIGLLAVIAIVAFVWFGREGMETSVNTTSSTNRGAVTGTQVPDTTPPAATPRP